MVGIFYKKRKTLVWRTSPKASRATSVSINSIAKTGKNVNLGQKKNTFIHCVEEMLGVKRYLSEKDRAELIDDKGRITEKYLYCFDESILGDVSKRFGKFEKAFDYFNAIQYGKLGNANTQMLKAKDVKNIIELIYKNANGRELLADCEPIDERYYKH